MSEADSHAIVRTNEYCFVCRNDFRCNQFVIIGDAHCHDPTGARITEGLERGLLYLSGSRRHEDGHVGIKVLN